MFGLNTSLKLCGRHQRLYLGIFCCLACDSWLHVPCSFSSTSPAALAICGWASTLLWAFLIMQPRHMGVWAPHYPDAGLVWVGALMALVKSKDSLSALKPFLTCPCRDRARDTHLYSFWTGKENWAESPEPLGVTAMKLAFTPSSGLGVCGLEPMTFFPS